MTDGGAGTATDFTGQTAIVTGGARGIGAAETARILGAGCMLSQIPRGRFLEVAEAAAMICWRAPRENPFTTGAVFDLSGGHATY